MRRRPFRVKNYKKLDSRDRSFLTRDDTKRISDIVVAWIGVLGLFGGGIITLINYNDRIQEEKTKLSLDYIKRYQSSYKKLEIIYAEQRSNHSTDIEKAIESGSSELLSLNIAIIESDRVMRHALWELVDFYESIYFCIREQLCNEDILLSYFGTYAMNIYQGGSGDYIHSLRREESYGDPNYGKGLFCIAYPRESGC